MKDGIKTITDGSQTWRNALFQFHRLNNLPAVIFKDGDRSYLIEGKYHRTNGPANTWKNGYKEYYINGIKQTKPEQYTLWIYNKAIT